MKRIENYPKKLMVKTNNCWSEIFAKRLLVRIFSKNLLIENSFKKILIKKLQISVICILFSSVQSKFSQVQFNWVWFRVVTGKVFYSGKIYWKVFQFSCYKKNIKLFKLKTLNKCKINHRISWYESLSMPYIQLKANIAVKKIKNEMSAVFVYHQIQWFVNAKISQIS